ncbi:MAG: PAS domain-containing protein [Magnetococcales bacterium]|nr:PAS domain-containing protein [Magnetococcales bacterium]
MTALPVTPRGRQFVRMLWLRFLILFGLLLFVWQTSLGKVEPYHSVRYVLGGFVAGLFLLTLGQLWWLQRGANPEMPVRLQCALDPLLVTVLVILTGSFDSPFLFLNTLVTLNAALLLGRREALLTAGMILILSAGMLSLTTLLAKKTVEPAPVLLWGFLWHGGACFLTALLGGALVRRADLWQQAFDRQADSLADLTALQEQIVTAMPYGLISVNNQGIIRAVNPGARELLGMEMLARMSGQPLHSLFPEFQWVLDHAQGEEVYLEIPRKERIWGVNCSVLHDRLGERIGALLVIRDLTLMKRLERELALKERLALTGRMAAGMAHEIRNPLAAILSAVQMLTPREAREIRCVAIIREEVNRLKQLTTDFLALSRPARPACRRVDVRAFLVEMADRLRLDPGWGSRELGLRLPEEAAELLADPEHLRQIFWNLLLNAMQATGERGRVEVEVFLTRERVRVVVSDDGPGVEDVLLTRLIEPFFTTRSGGSGLGLAVVHHLVFLNGGRLRFRNGAPGGLRVELEFERGDGGDSGM